MGDEKNEIIIQFNVQQKNKVLYLQPQKRRDLFVFFAKKNVS